MRDLRARKGAAVRAAHNQCSWAHMVTLFPILISPVIITVGFRVPMELVAMECILISVSVLVWQSIAILDAGVSMSMALNCLSVSVPQKEVENCVLETELSITEMPFIWRFMFYRALTPRVTRILKKVMAHGGASPGESPGVANTQLKAGESRV